MFYPQLSTLKKYAKEFNRIPIYKELDISNLDLLSLLKALQFSETLIFLESAKENKKWSRFSFFGLKAQKTISFYGTHIEIEKNGKKEIVKEDFFEYLKKELKKYNSPIYRSFGDFNGGYVGYLGFEMVNYCKILRRNIKENKNIPLASLSLIDDFIVYDNKKDKYFLATCIYTDKDLNNEYISKCSYLIEKEREIIKLLKKTTIPFLPQKPQKIHLNYSTPKEEFLRKVMETKRMIAEGEAIQVVLSIRASIEDEIDPYRFYLKLRSLNPSPYMFFLKFKDIYIVGSSPEIHVKVEKNKVYLKPIAGTIKQGRNKKENLINKQKLLKDPKENAEHLMLVDLARNDLGRIAKTGTVKVEKFMRPEDYSHVIHLVSLVTCEISEDKHMIDIIRETFPAGTVSGAPKVRAIEIIDELEPHPRDIYAGAIGYFGFNQCLDTCITIRTAVFSPTMQYLQAGAGIVYDSIPEKEFEEINNKLMALSVSLGYAKK